MKNNFLILMLVLVIAIAFYFLGKKNAGNDMKATMLQNVQLIREISELGALEVSGSVKLTLTNRGDNQSMWTKMKNFFAENTLQVAIPFEAKYGVDLNNREIHIDTKSGTALVRLPKTKLLSLQLKLDKVDAISKTGLFNTLTVDEFVKAQKQLYEDALRTLETNANYHKLAEGHIRFILEKYYAPLGYTVTCKFGESMP